MGLGLRMVFQYDSRKINPGDVYLCLPGGERYQNNARKRGAKEIRTLSRAEMAALASEYYRHPSHKLCVLGVTGTNGKTTTVTLLGQMLASAGFRPKVSGTLTGSLTTPESLDLQRAMAEALHEGCSHFVMEVSSHGIAQDRVRHIQFAGKGLTNITQDHLDFHGSFENYRETKLMFMREFPGWALLPADYEKIRLPPEYPLLGQFNRQNAQLAKAMLLRLGIAETPLDAALSRAQAPKGRFQAVDTGALGFYAVVDYAHTPDGLAQVLTTAREVMRDRRLTGVLWAVFGCGGDRDAKKRPIMGAIAARLADQIVVTSDNPRSENPQSIIAAILNGIPNDQRLSTKDFPDRREAIRYVSAHAQPGDFIVVAGKGHEDYQIIGAEKFPFDDAEELQKALQIRLAAPARP
jgi:UDP-N-acetylmuramoyl-L-alanyl-D-glutamate--2,6-diaminopimelate ligase